MTDALRDIRRYWQTLHDAEVGHNTPMVEAFVDDLLEGLDLIRRTVPDPARMPEVWIALRMATVRNKVNELMKEPKEDV